jgi:hypothetical protein
MVKAGLLFNYSAMPEVPPIKSFLFLSLAVFLKLLFLCAKGLYHFSRKINPGKISTTGARIHGGLSLVYIQPSDMEDSKSKFQFPFSNNIILGWLFLAFHPAGADQNDLGGAKPENALLRVGPG